MDALMVSLGTLHSRLRPFRDEMQPFIETATGHRFQCGLFQQNGFPAQHTFAFPAFHDRYTVFERYITAEPRSVAARNTIRNMLTDLTAFILNVDDNTVVHDSFLHFHTNNFRIEFTPMGGAILFMTITPQAAAPAGVQSMMHALDRLLNTTDIREPV